RADEADENDGGDGDSAHGSPRRTAGRLSLRLICFGLLRNDLDAADRLPAVPAGADQQLEAAELEALPRRILGAARALVGAGEHEVHRGAVGRQPDTALE